MHIYRYRYRYRYDTYICSSRSNVIRLFSVCLETNDFLPIWDAMLCCHRLKSGLPACICARTGAVLGGATAAQETALGDYFLALGLAFQILDDVINLQVSPY